MDVLLLPLLLGAAARPLRLGTAGLPLRLGAAWRPLRLTAGGRAAAVAPRPLLPLPPLLLSAGGRPLTLLMGLPLTLPLRTLDEGGDGRSSKLEGRGGVSPPPLSAGRAEGKEEGISSGSTAPVGGPSLRRVTAVLRAEAMASSERIRLAMLALRGEALALGLPDEEEGLLELIVGAWQ